MGWRSWVTCCGADAVRRNVSACCCCVCGGKGRQAEEAASGMQQQEQQQPRQHQQEHEEELDKTFVFLEQYRTDVRIEKPVVSFIGELPVVLHAGRMVVIEGRVMDYAIRMSVNLTCGTSPTADLAFHLNPRFEQKLVVRNCRINKHWGEEETSAAKRFPFMRGKEFQMQLLSAEEEFLVAFNGEHFCGYTYRVPLERIQMIQVNGDVEVYVLEYKKVNTYPLPYGNKTQFLIKSDDQSVSPQVLLDTPFTGIFPQSFCVGKEVEIFGQVKLLPHSFYLNLQDSTNVWPHPIIPLHINPRFKPGQQGGVVRNAWVKGKWGNEEKAPFHLFKPGQQFRLKIVCEEDQYALSVDNINTACFKHRADPETVSCLYIQGDIFIKDVVLRTTKVEKVEKKLSEHKTPKKRRLALDY